MTAHRVVFSSHRMRLRRPQTWALVLTAWLLGRTARAQDVDDLRPAEDPFALVARHRDDDPDLVRPGVHPTPAAALAPGVRVLHVAAVDLDVRHEGLVMAVAPQEDPSPENDRPGTVLAVRDARGWRATVLFRELPPDPIGVTAIVDDGWDVVILRGRRALVLRHTTSDLFENASGLGHHFHRVHRATLLRWADGVRFALCEREDDDEQGVGPWHAPGIEGRSRRPAPAWCRARATTSWRADR